MHPYTSHTLKHLTLIAEAVLDPAALPLFAELPPLIPRETLFGNPEKDQARISPNGKMLAYLAPDKGGILSSRGNMLAG